MVHYLKKIKSEKYLVFLTLFLLKAFTVYAAEINPPGFDKLKEILLRIVGVFLAASASALIIMIAYGIIKGSLAAGDPRGLEGAKSTWTYAVYGFLVVILSMLILTIIRSRLGLTGSVGFGLFFDNITNAVDSLVNIGVGNGSSQP